MNEQQLRLKDKQLDYESQLHFYTLLRRNSRFTRQLLADDIRKHRPASLAVNARSWLIGSTSVAGGLFVFRSIIASVTLGVSATLLDYYLTRPAIL